MGVGKIIENVLHFAIVYGKMEYVGEMGLTRMEEWTTPENKVTKACYSS